MDWKTVLEVGEEVRFLPLEEMFSLGYYNETAEDYEFPEEDLMDDGDRYEIWMEPEDVENAAGHAGKVIDRICCREPYHWHYRILLDNGKEFYPACPSMFCDPYCEGGEIESRENDDLFGILFGGGPS